MAKEKRRRRAIEEDQHARKRRSQGLQAEGRVRPTRARVVQDTDHNPPPARARPSRHHQETATPAENSHHDQLPMPDDSTDDSNFKPNNDHHRLLRARPAIQNIRKLAANSRERGKRAGRWRQGDQVRTRGGRHSRAGGQTADVREAQDMSQGAGPGSPAAARGGDGDVYRYRRTRAHVFADDEAEEVESGQEQGGESEPRGESDEPVEVRDLGVSLGSQDSQEDGRGDSEYEDDADDEQAEKSTDSYVAEDHDDATDPDRTTAHDEDTRKRYSLRARGVEVGAFKDPFKMVSDSDPDWTLDKVERRRPPRKRARRTLRCISTGGDTSDGSKQTNRSVYPLWLKSLPRCSGLFGHQTNSDIFSVSKLSSGDQTPPCRRESCPYKGAGSSRSRSRSKSHAHLQPVHVASDVSFADVGGLQEPLLQLQQMVFWPLLYPHVFQALNISPPRGALLHGPPGCGKTLAVRAIVSEAARRGFPIKLYCCRGGDLLSKYIGEAERRLKEMFDAAARNAPAIIFMDEVDGLAPVRSSDQAPHVPVVATLLALLDGITDRGRVLVIGATNRPDCLDPALRRKGRFDLELPFALPDRDARLSILHALVRKHVAPPPDPWLQRIAAATPGFSGADLEQVLTDASMRAVSRVLPPLGQQLRDTDVMPESSAGRGVDAGDVELTWTDLHVACEAVGARVSRGSSRVGSVLPEQLQPLLGSRVRHLHAILRTMWRGSLPPGDPTLTSAPSTPYGATGEHAGEADAQCGQASPNAATPDGTYLHAPDLSTEVAMVLLRSCPASSATVLADALLAGLPHCHVVRLAPEELLTSARGPALDADILHALAPPGNGAPVVAYLSNLGQLASCLYEREAHVVAAALRRLTRASSVLVLGVLEEGGDSAEGGRHLWQEVARGNRVYEYSLAGFQAREVEAYLRPVCCRIDAEVAAKGPGSRERVAVAVDKALASVRTRPEYSEFWRDGSHILRLQEEWGTGNEAAPTNLGAALAALDSALWEQLGGSQEGPDVTGRNTGSHEFVRLLALQMRQVVERLAQGYLAGEDPRGQGVGQQLLPGGGGAPHGRAVSGGSTLGESAQGGFNAKRWGPVVEIACRMTLSQLQELRTWLENLAEQHQGGRSLVAKTAIAIAHQIAAGPGPVRQSQNL